MAKKIEGWCYNNTESKDPHFTEWTGPHEPVGWKEHPTRLTQRATMVVHEGTHERVFTESEVKAFINALKDETLNKSVDHWIDHVARRMGFLDPA